MATLLEPVFYPSDPSELRDALGRIPWPVAAPSYVWPGALPGNCRTLSEVFSGAALLFFETRACLDYDSRDLPAWLSGLGLAYHVHLPLDLPWDAGSETAFAVAKALADKAAFLSPGAFVLHPPAEPGLLAAFAALWSEAGFSAEALVVENTKNAPLPLHFALVGELGLGVCLDLGHILAYAQESSLDLPGLTQRVRLAHLSAPAPRGGKTPGHGHFSLMHLDERGRDLARRILALTPLSATLVIEVFDPAGLCESVFVLEELCRGLSPAADRP